LNTLKAIDYIIRDYSRIVDLDKMLGNIRVPLLREIEPIHIKPNPYILYYGHAWHYDLGSITDIGIII
jgi:hypothetical protein